jgi:hypothetical protein
MIVAFTWLSEQPAEAHDLGGGVVTGRLDKQPDFFNTRAWAVGGDGLRVIEDEAPITWVPVLDRAGMGRAARTATS